MPKLVFMTGVALCVVTIAFLLTDRLLFPPCVENAQRVRLGMTQQEVEAVLGRAADHTLGLWDIRLRHIGSWQVWVARTETALIHFSRQSERNEDVVRWVVVFHRSTRQSLYVSGEPEPLDVAWVLSNSREFRARQQRTAEPGALLDRLLPRVEQKQKDGL
jgi:hypothetical protein